ncbi:hypothetical protein [Flavicella marina]|uniref:hypothetical protein n=1 Tax=Flavicella marina TaxID=1475951 RepID=UPI001264F927|nr:hypothetical protein [Flavicella marina]
MKNLYKSLAFAAVLIGFTSCSEETTITEELSQEAPLKSYSLSKSDDGSIVLEHTLSSGNTSTVLSGDSGNEIIINEGNGNGGVQSTVLPLINNELKVDFVSNHEVKIPGISILDDVTSTSASSKTIKLVKNYKITLLEDGSYQLDFKLQNNYVASFGFNEELNRHEIYLDPGVSEGKNKYSKNYLKFDGEKLNIVFMRNISTTTLSARSSHKYKVDPPEFEIQ